jgi:HPt (histidine-containing phosphotransfer) domain-containing protein
MQRNSETELVAADPDTDVFDRGKLLYSTDDDEELANTLVEVFLETVSSTLTSLRDAIAVGDARALRSAAHSLKGAAATVTAGQVASAAQALETCGANGTLDRAPFLLDHLAASLAEFRERLG